MSDTMRESAPRSSRPGRAAGHPHRTTTASAGAPEPAGRWLAPVVFGPPIGFLVSLFTFLVLGIGAAASILINLAFAAVLIVALAWLVRPRRSE